MAAVKTFLLNNLFYNHTEMYVELFLNKTPGLAG